MKKTIKSAVTIALILCLVLSMMSVLASAANDYNIVNFGDAASMGYMFLDYKDSETGYGGASSSSAINTLKKYIAKKLGSEANVKLKDFSFKSLRFNEVYSLLVPDTEETDLIAQTNLPLYATAYGKTLPGFSADVKAAVENADLITFDIGMGEFTSHIVNAFATNQDSILYSPLLNDLINILDTRTSALLNTLRGTLNLVIDKNTFQKADEFIDAMLYFYGSFVEYFAMTMDTVFTLNPDAEVIVTSMYNPLPDISVTYGSTVIDISAITRAVIDSINLYITTINDHRSQFKYADLSDGCQVFVDEVASGSYSNDTINLVAKSLYTQNPITFNTFLYEDIIAKYGLVTWETLAITLKALYLDPLINYNMVYDAYTSNSAGATLSSAYTCIRYAFDLIMDAFSNAANIRSVDTAVLTYDMGNRFAALQNYDSTKVTPEDKIALHTYLRFDGYGNFGMYPSPKGMQSKADALKIAYESKFYADNSLIQKAVSGISFITPDLAQSISDFISKAVDFIRNLITNFSGLIEQIKSGIHININI